MLLHNSGKQTLMSLPPDVEGVGWIHKFWLWEKAYLIQLILKTQLRLLFNFFVYNLARITAVLASKANTHTKPQA